MEIVISICIPTFNRLDSLKRTVQNFLDAHTNGLNLVITDNASTDGTKEYFSKHTFPNVLYLPNETNIGGTTNVVKALSNANGKYALLCLDKDQVNLPVLINSIALINDHELPKFGRFLLHETPNAPTVEVYNKGLDALLKTGFLSEHPSGVFFESETFKSLPIVNQILSENIKFPFYVDVLLAHFSANAPAYLVNKPAIVTENLANISSKGSLTYTSQNVYFLPKQRIATFYTYLKNLNNLTLPNTHKAVVELKLVKALEQDLTINLASLYQNKPVCMHYGLVPKTLKKYNFWQNIITFYANYLGKQTTISFSKKLSLCLKWIKRQLR